MVTLENIVSQYGKAKATRLSRQAFKYEQTAVAFYRIHSYLSYNLNEIKSMR
jgi:hypothetical protein